MINLGSWVRHLKPEVLVRNTQANSGSHQLDFSKRSIGKFHKPLALPGFISKTNETRG